MKRNKARNERLLFKLLAVSPVVFVVLLTACNPQVKKFTAVPRHICAGELVQLEWSVIGSARIRVIPPSDRLPDGPVDDEGNAVIAPNANTNVELRVTRPLGNPTASVQEIVVLGGEAKRETLTASLGDASSTPSCSDGKVRATVHAKRFSPKVKVATVVSHPEDGRTYEVEHAGRSASIKPGEVVSAFLDTPLAGDWTLSAPVSEGQTCESVPPVLVIDVDTQCLGEGNP